MSSSVYGGATGVIAQHPFPCRTGWHASFQRNHPADKDRGNTGRVYDVFALISDLCDRDDPVIQAPYVTPDIPTIQCRPAQVRF